MGMAYIGENRYCHGTYDPGPTCYELAQRSSMTTESGFNFPTATVTCKYCGEKFTKIDQYQDRAIKRAVGDLTEHVRTEHPSHYQAGGKS